MELANANNEGEDRRNKPKEESIRSWRVGNWGKFTIMLGGRWTIEFDDHPHQL